MPKFDARELATVLAALRYWQRGQFQQDTTEWDVATDGGTLQPLDGVEIDELCERINCEDAEDEDASATDTPPEPTEAGPEREYEVKMYRTAADLMSANVRVKARSRDDAIAKAIEGYESNSGVDWECEEPDWPAEAGGGWLPECFEVSEVAGTDE